MDKSAAPARPPYRARRCRDTGDDLMVERARTEGTLSRQNAAGVVLRGRADEERESDSTEDDIGRPRRNDRRQEVHPAE